MKVSLEIEINNIEVQESNYNFDYKLYVNGEIKGSDKFEDNHSRNSLEDFKSDLEKGYAYETLMQNIYWEDLLI